MEICARLTSAPSFTFHYRFESRFPSAQRVLGNISDIIGRRCRVDRNTQSDFYTDKYLTLSNASGWQMRKHHNLTLPFNPKIANISHIRSHWDRRETIVRMRRARDQET